MAPLQYSFLGNPTDRGVWWATVHAVSESWMRLSTCIQPVCVFMSTFLSRYLSVCCVCLSVCACECVHVCLSVYVCMHMWSVCVCVSKYVCLCVYMCIFLCVFVSFCVCVCKVKKC